MEDKIVERAIVSLLERIYENVNDNWRWLLKYREAARRLGYRWMRRRSHTGSQLNWAKYRLFLERNPLVLPGRITDLIALSRGM